MDTETNLALNKVLTSIIDKNLTAESRQWLFEKASLVGDTKSNYQLNLTFTSIPRRTGKNEILLEEGDGKKLQSLLEGLDIKGWTIDRLCRVWLLMQLDTSDKEGYVNRIENLFPQAEMNELVALYSALPVLAYPEAWILRCAEGVRSNIGTVLEALMYGNPYPGEYMDEGAWNQLVLKAFFTDKDVNRIVGLDKRMNASLANTLFDYVEERRAAGRTVNPQIWRLTAKYIDQSHFYLFESLIRNGNEKDKLAGALALRNSSFEKAGQLLNQFPELKSAVDNKQVTWQML